MSKNIGLARLHHISRLTLSDEARTLQEYREIAEATAIRRALKRHNYRIQDAASELGISRITLYRLIQKYSTPRQRKPISS